jgi:hypothetical protein
MDRPPVPSDPDAFFREYLPAFMELSGRPLGNVTSVGSVTFRVLDAGEWSLRLREGVLEVTRGMEDDVVIQVTTLTDDFGALLSEMAERAERGQSAGAKPSARKGPLGALVADAETARMVRHVPGSVLFVARDGDVRRRVVFTPGRRAASVDSAECTIECALDDLREAGRSGASPMALFVAGKLKVTGNVQIAMALSAVLG